MVIGIGVFIIIFNVNAFGVQPYDPFDLLQFVLPKYNNISGSYPKKPAPAYYDCTWGQRRQHAATPNAPDN